MPELYYPMDSGFRNTTHGFDAGIILCVRKSCKKHTLEINIQVQVILINKHLTNKNKSKNLNKKYTPVQSVCAGGTIIA